VDRALRSASIVAEDGQHGLADALDGRGQAARHHSPGARTAIPAAASASRTAAAISAAPGVSPWMQRVSTARGRTAPPTAVTR
jgi:hypothetical protein